MILHISAGPFALPCECAAGARTTFYPDVPRTIRSFISLSFMLDILVHMYHNNTMKTIQRVQTGVRIEKRLLKVLKGLAEYLDISVGDLLEGVLLHSFDNKLPFGDKTLQKIEQLKKVYELDLGSADSHKLTEGTPT